MTKMMIFTLFLSISAFGQERLTSCDRFSKNWVFASSFIGKSNPKIVRSIMKSGSDDLQYINTFNMVNLACSKFSKVKPYFQEIGDYDFEFFPNQFGYQSLLKLQRYIRQYDTFEVDPHIERLETQRGLTSDHIATINLDKPGNTKKIQIITRCIKRRTRDIETFSCYAVKLCEDLDTSDLMYSSDGLAYEKVCKKLNLK